MTGKEISEREAKAVEAAVAREIEGAETPAEVEVHEDKTKEMRTPGFSRMRFDWNGPDATVMQTILQVADDRVAVAFTDAYQIMNDIYEIVRVKKVDPETGEVVTGRHGWPLWETTDSGRFVEDYGRLGEKERDTFMFQIVTRLFDWEQRSAEHWAEAMFAKAQWEERFAISFSDTSEGGRKTDEAMTQRGRLGSREERYFALFEAAVSRKSEALVKSMERISQRLKDSIYR